MRNTFKTSALILLISFLAAAFILSNLFFFLSQPSPAVIYALAFFLGIGVGYWSVFVTIAAEHFGTNMRATVATTAASLASSSSTAVISAS